MQACASQAVAQWVPEEQQLSFATGTHSPNDAALRSMPYGDSNDLYYARLGGCITKADLAKFVPPLIWLSDARVAGLSSI